MADRRRCRSIAAVSDRRGEPRDNERAQGAEHGARRRTSATRSRRAGRPTSRRPASAGTPRRSRSRACAPKSTTWSRTISSRSFRRGGQMGGWPPRLWDLDKHWHYERRLGRLGRRLRAAGSRRRRARRARSGPLRDQLQRRRRFHGRARARCGPRRITRSRCLTIVHNNRAWHQETMHLQRMADRRDREPEHAKVGTLIDEPEHRLTRSWPSRSASTVKARSRNPSQLGPALARALKVVKNGMPAVVDVVVARALNDEGRIANARPRSRCGTSLTLAAASAQTHGRRAGAARRRRARQGRVHELRLLRMPRHRRPRQLRRRPARSRRTRRRGRW